MTRSSDRCLVPRVQVNLQLKSTTAQVVNEGLVGLSLPIKNYDDLRDTTGIVPHYLLVLQLPPIPAEWLAVNATELLIRGVAYYGNLHGLPAVLNTTSRVVTMPQSQRFDVDALTRMVLAAPERIWAVRG